MPNFEVYDTVVVKTDPTLVGTVERTHSSPDSYDSLEEQLILRHVPVPQSALTEFVTSGTPPRGFVFISSRDEDKGNFLASENDLILLCRSFDLGDIVKREDGITGTVVDVTDTYTIQPLWLLYDEGVTLDSDLYKNHLRDCDSAVPEECPHSILSHVPGQELTHKQALFEDDLICYKDWLGLVSDLDVDVIVKLGDNSIVALDSPDDLYMPIPEPGKPLVSLPELTNPDIKRPELPSAFQGYPWVIPTRYPRPGTFVVMDPKTLRNGRWIRGQYSARSVYGGVVLDLVPRQMVAHWLACNPFAPLKCRQVFQPQLDQDIYLNHSSYTSTRTLRPSPDLRVIDLSSPPRGETLRSEASDNQNNNNSHEVKPASLHQDLKVGDCVRFRDPSAAAVKYQGHEDTFSGRFNRISEDLTYGWDLNTFKVIAKNQNIQILWQDGTTILHNSNEIQRFGGFEPDFAPTDLVVHRTGLKQRPHGSKSFQDFNEMSFFESPHSLQPAKVGVIQYVDARERVAKVRWFQNPQVLLVHNGDKMSAGSRLGPIGDTIEEVSLYEVMTFPAFDRRLKDVALLVPQTPSNRAMTIMSLKKEIRVNSQQSLPDLHGTPLQLFAHARDAFRLRGFLEEKRASLESTSENSDTGIDWLGEIINTGLDGSTTVRLSGATPCRDVKVSPDEILAVIHLDYVEADEDNSDQSMDDEEFFESYLGRGVEESTSVSYEGGERIDDDSGDENWESAEEDDQKGNDPPSQDDTSVTVSDDEMPDIPEYTAPPTPFTFVPASPHSPSSAEANTPSATSLVVLSKHVPEEIPPSFSILSIPPPLDQYQRPNQISGENAPSSAFLKRLRQEHKVLSSSLPSGQIYVRTYESRLDLLRCLIIGPSDTPYEHAPFLIDLYLPPDFPSVPPTAHFHSWTSGLGRINPNLYEEGKICLSLLGTWPGKAAGEGWTKNATILQVLVSLQGLVMVPKPFYNEAGFENEEAGGVYVNESSTYTERAFVMARGFVGFALTKPPVGVEDVLAWLYLPNLSKKKENGVPIEIANENDHSRNTKASDISNDKNNSPDTGSTDLLRTVIHRADKLIQASEDLRAGSTVKAETTTTQISMDGSGELAHPTKAFLKPLSRGAVVMLKRQLAQLKGWLSDLMDESK